MFQPLEVLKTWRLVANLSFRQDWLPSLRGTLLVFPEGSRRKSTSSGLSLLMKWTQFCDLRTKPWRNSQDWHYHDIQYGLLVNDNICRLCCFPHLLSAVFFVLPVQQSTWVCNGWQWPPSCTSRSSLSCCSASPSSHRRGLYTPVSVHVVRHSPQAPHWSQSCSYL